MNREDWAWVGVILAIIFIAFGGIIYGAAAYPTYQKGAVITNVISYQGDNSPRQIITVKVNQDGTILNVTSTCDFYKVGQSVTIEFFPQGHWWIWQPSGTPNNPPIIANPYFGC